MVLFNTLINIPKCQDHISWGGIEQVKDMFFYSPKYEGGMVCGPSPHVMIFSNKEPSMEAMSQDRWKITNYKKCTNCKKKK